MTTSSQSRFRRAGALRTACVLGLSLAACEPAARPKAELLLQGRLYIDPSTLEPYSGPVFTIFAGSPPRIEQRASLRDGRYDGPFEWYFESGRLYERGTYVNGRLEGPYEAYYESGGLYERGTYHAGAFHGPREWYLDGRLIERVTYEHGRIRGRYERYGESGQLDLGGILLDGQPCGTWLEGPTTITYPPCVET